jgi:hypothetical protein
MVRKLAAAVFSLVIVLSVASPIFAQDSMAKEARVEGRVVRSNKDKSTITVRTGETNAEKNVYYDASTKFTSAYHNDKTTNTIDADQIKDGDYVIALGSWNDKKEFHAASVSKRLSHPN